MVVKKMSEDAIKQLEDLRKEVRYTTADFAIEYIVDQFGKEELVIPTEFQRGYVWNKKDKCKFIESILLGLPIPFMFFSDTDDGRIEVIDGAQRTQTLVQYLNNDLQLSGLIRLDGLNGYRFRNLSDYYQRKFKKTSLRVVQLAEETNEDTRREIFSRINTTGKAAKPAEVRRGMFSDTLLKKLVEKCASKPAFRKLCPMSQMCITRFEDQELVARYFVYLNHYEEFDHDVTLFINKHYQDDFDTEQYEEEFDAMVSFVDKYFPNGFARELNKKVTPHVRFEAISVGVSLALRINPNLQPDSLSWLDSEEFELLTRSDASNSKQRLAKRIEFVRDKLLGVSNAL